MADPAKQPGKAMLIVRFAISIVLCVGVGAFGFYAINELANRQPTPSAMDNNFGTSTGTPASTRPTTGEPLTGLAQPDPAQFIQINRDNPHPGEIVPYLNSAPYQFPPNRLPNTGDEVWEQCHYGIGDGNLRELIAYYNAQASNRGLAKLYESPTTDASRPGGIRAAWSNGSERLEVTVWPVAEDTPRAAPLRPRNPLRWVVKYIYASSADAP